MTTCFLRRLNGDLMKHSCYRSVIEDSAGWPQNYSADKMASVSRGGSLPRPPSIIP